MPLCCQYKKLLSGFSGVFKSSLNTYADHWSILCAKSSKEGSLCFPGIAIFPPWLPWCDSNFTVVLFVYIWINTKKRQLEVPPFRPLHLPEPRPFSSIPKLAETPCRSLRTSSPSTKICSNKWITVGNSADRGLFVPSDESDSNEWN
jgi:hypothetical protein